MKPLIIAFCYLLAANSVFALQSEQPMSVKPLMQTVEWAQSWWLPRHQEKLTLKQQMSSVDLVFLGDSITHGFETKGQHVWRQYYQPRNALNLGFSGDRTEHVLWRLEHGAVDDISPKLVVLMIGTNNTGHRQAKPEKTALGIQAILTQLAQRLPNTKVLLLAIFPRGVNADDPLRQINAGVNEIIKSYDDGERVHYLDINHIFLDEQGILHRDVMTDLLHPNKPQYKRWAQAIEPAVIKLMAN
ncbi:acetylglucosamine-6-sulfatase [Thalassotalea sp. HSM 43]|uniref:GDSL-type esterase/lipase family protein n=1 Tax=Thalassotalea sp. HSM 43 TaxID=2552945 RepID=UPI00107FE243|nr:GDSL-type esterase/lipase family protein [Thalassotalea sp. HSM 43]QBY04244.1 acetylglucosamine-6-sulfatase [Thalassotalea sp. HSM 43]